MHAELKYHHLGGPMAGSVLLVELLGLFLASIVGLAVCPNIFSGLSYRALSDLVKVSKKGNSGFGVNVYDNGRLLEGSPFSSYTQAALAMGNVNISSVISKKIYTDKLYKGRYKFESSV